MNPSLLFLAGGILAALSLYPKKLIWRVLPLLGAMACFAMGGAEIGKATSALEAKSAATEAARQRHQAAQEADGEKSGETNP